MLSLSSSSPPLSSPPPSLPPSLSLSQVCFKIHIPGPVCRIIAQAAHNTGASRCLVLGSLHHSHLDQEEGVSLLLVGGVADDEHTSIPRQVIAARDDCANLQRHKGGGAQGKWLRGHGKHRRGPRGYGYADMVSTGGAQGTWLPGLGEARGPCRGGTGHRSGAGGGAQGIWLRRLGEARG